MSFFNVLSVFGLWNDGQPRPVDQSNRLPVQLDGPIQTLDSSDTEYLRIATSITNAGDNLLVTPAAGKRIRLRRVYVLNDPTAQTSSKVTIKLGSLVAFVVWGIAQRGVVVGPVDGALIINLSRAGDFAVTIQYEEI